MQSLRVRLRGQAELEVFGDFQVDLGLQRGLMLLIVLDGQLNFI